MFWCLNFEENSVRRSWRSWMTRMLASLVRITAGNLGLRPRGRCEPRNLASDMVWSDATSLVCMSMKSRQMICCEAMPLHIGSIKLRIISIKRCEQWGAGSPVHVNQGHRSRNPILDRPLSSPAPVAVSAKRLRLTLSISAQDTVCAGWGWNTLLYIFLHCTIEIIKLFDFSEGSTKKIHFIKMKFQKKQVLHDDEIQDYQARSVPNPAALN